MSIIIRLQNLPLTANSLDIRRFFQGLEIPDGGVHIVGGDHGDAFIAFSTDEDARQAMERNGNQIKGSQIKLLLSSKNEMQRIIEDVRNQMMAAVMAQQQPSSSAAIRPLAPQMMTVPPNRPPQMVTNQVTNRPPNMGQMYPGQASLPVTTRMPSIGMGLAANYPQQSQPTTNSISNDHQQKDDKSTNRRRSRSPSPTLSSKRFATSSDNDKTQSVSTMHSGLMGSLKQEEQGSQSMPSQRQPQGQNAQYSGLGGVPGSGPNPNYPQQVGYPHQPPQGPMQGPPPSIDPRWNGGGGQFVNPPRPTMPQHSGPPPIPIQNNNPPTQRKFTVQLLHLPMNIQIQDILRFFHPLYLTEDDVKLCYDPKGIPTGIALVHFNSPMEFETALSYNNRVIGGDRPAVIKPLDTMNPPPPPVAGPPISNDMMPPMPSQMPQIRPDYPGPHPSMPPPFHHPAPPPQSEPPVYGPYICNYKPILTKEYAVYMKGLPYHMCTREHVINFFKPIPLVNIEIENDHRGNLTGNVFVEFSNQQEFDHGMSFNMRHMGTRYIELLPIPMYEKYGPSYHLPSIPPPVPIRGRGGHHRMRGFDHPPPPPPPPHQSPTYCVSVRGLSKHVTSKNLKMYFSKMGIEPYCVHLKCTPDGLSSGIAFVEFNTKEHQMRALEHDGEFIGTDRIRIEMVPYEIVRDATGSGGGGGNKNVGGPRGVGGGPPFNRRSTCGRTGLPPFSNKYTILIAKNIPQRTKDKDLCTFFEDYFITPNRVKFLRNRNTDNDDDEGSGNESNKYEAHISFLTKADAEHAQRNMDKKHFLGKKIFLTFAA